jgi:hypothetical protein
MTSRDAAPRPLTVLLAALVIVAAGAASLLPGGLTPAAAQQRCDGVWVVVDAKAAGGPVTTRCVAGDPASGYEALHAAGHTSTDHPRFPGMVCTIDGRPDPCNGAPPDAHWSYWYAEAGGSWTYSSRGANDRDPAPGQVEGWAFGAGSPPRIPPPSDPPEPEPSPSPTASPSPTPSPSPTRTAEPAPAPRPTSEPDDAASTAADREPSSPSEDVATPDEGPQDEAGPTDDPDEDASAATAAPRPPAPPSPRERAGQTPAPSERPPVELRDTDDEVALDRPGDGGAMAGLIAGGALAATIAGAGFFQARRRRQELGP